MTSCKTTTHLDSLTEPTLRDASKIVVRAIKRKLSFRRRRGPSAGTQTAAVTVDSGTDPVPLPRRVSWSLDARESLPLPGLPPRASAVRAAVDFSSTARPGLSRRHSSAGLPPRASDVRAAVNLSTTRRGLSRRSSVGLPPRASDVREAMTPLYGEPSLGPMPTVGLVRAPSQPDALVGIVKRASVAQPARAGRLERRRERRLANFEGNLGRRMESIPPPPRASDVARAIRDLEM